MLTPRPKAVRPYTSSGALGIRALNPCTRIPSPQSLVPSPGGHGASCTPLLIVCKMEQIVVAADATLS
jgi:phosphatidylserine decarboxylase